MPLTDWQFVVVTIVVIASATVVVRSVLPRRKKAKGRRTTLTIEGREHKK